MTLYNIIKIQILPLRIWMTLCPTQHYLDSLCLSLPVLPLTGIGEKRIRQQEDKQLWL